MLNLFLLWGVSSALANFQSCAEMDPHSAAFKAACTTRTAPHVAATSFAQPRVYDFQCEKNKSLEELRKENAPLLMKISTGDAHSATSYEEIWEKRRLGGTITSMQGDYFYSYRESGIATICNFIKKDNLKNAIFPVNRDYLKIVGVSSVPMPNCVLYKFQVEDPDIESIRCYAGSDSPALLEISGSLRGGGSEWTTYELVPEKPVPSCFVDNKAKPSAPHSLPEGERKEHSREPEGSPAI